MMQLKSIYKSHCSLTITQRHAMIVHGLPQECGQSVAGGKTKKRDPKHALSWTLRTRTDPRFLLSIFHDLSLFATRRDAPSSSFSLFLYLLLFLSLPSCSDKWQLWLSRLTIVVPALSLSSSLSLSLFLSLLSYRY